MLVNWAWVCGLDKKALGIVEQGREREREIWRDIWRESDESERRVSGESEEWS